MGDFVPGGEPRFLGAQAEALTAGRGLAWIDEDALVRAAGAGAVDINLARVEASIELEQGGSARAVLSLLWVGQWTTDLRCPLSGSSLLRPARAAA